MSIGKDQTALCSDVVSELKSENSVPTSFLDGVPFSEYYYLENSGNLFSNSYETVTESTRSKIFQNLAGKKVSYSNVDVSVEPTNLNESPLPECPIVLFDDLRNMVIKAFLPLTNIRKSSFKIIKKNAYPALDTLVYDATLLNESAILGENGNTIASNQREESKHLVETIEQFFDELSDRTDLIANINFKPLDSNLSAYQVSTMINAVSAATDYIRKNLSCEFKTNKLFEEYYVTYHKINQPNTTIRSESLYFNEPYIVSGYPQDLWPLPTDYTFDGWNTENSQVVKYRAGTQISVLNNINLYPVYTIAPQNVTVTYDSRLNSSVIRRDGNVKIVPQNSTYPIVGMNANGLYFTSGNESKYTLQGYSTTKDSGTVNRNVGQTINVYTTPLSLWTVFIASQENRTSSDTLGHQIEWYTKYFQKKSKFWTNAGNVRGVQKTPYPFVYSAPYLKDALKLKFVFTGWVNERRHHHITKIYATVKDNKGYTYVKDKLLFQYKQDPYNEFSVHIAQDKKYNLWPEVSTSFMNAPNNGATKFYFYFRILDDLRNYTVDSGSNGVVSIKRIEYIS